MALTQHSPTRRSVLITGAARGIGLATAIRLAESGFLVYGMVRSSSDTHLLDAASKSLSSKLHRVYGDVTDEASVHQVVQSIVKETGRIDVAINNACHVVVGTCETCTLAEQQETLNVNYFGPVRVVQAVLPYMRAQRSGQIVNISSVAGYEPFPHLETYVASKFALEGLTESLAIHTAPWNIRVSLVEPGGVRTEAPRQAPFGSRPLSDTGAYKRYFALAKQHMIDGYETSMNPQEVARVIEDILHAARPHLRYPIGDFAHARAQARFCDPTGDSSIEFKRNLLTESSLYLLLGK